MRVRMLAALVSGLCFAPLAAQAAPCAGFTDVDSTASYCAAATFIKNKGVTLGCGDGTKYCPNDFVTRAQMALFMQRLAGGGSGNVLPDATSTIAGGQDNTIIGTTNWSTIGGGISNEVSGNRAVVGGGSSNTASGGGSTVAGGYQNTASGQESTVPGGRFNVASGDDSFAAGLFAQADQPRCAVFSLWSTSTGISCIGSPYIFRIGSNHGFSVDYYSQRPDGGGTRWAVIGDVFAGQTISSWTGAYLSDGGVWTNNSDVAAKTDFVEVDTLDVLDRVMAMPLSTWRYKTENGQRHLGPMAQDFHAAFGLGADNRHITTLDESGVALAAIKGLNEKLELANAELLRRNESLERRLAAIEQAMGR